MISHRFFTVSKAFSETCFASVLLEWKFIEFSGLFHCLIIKVQSEIRDFAAISFARLLCCSLTATLSVYHALNSLSSTFLKKVFLNLFLNCLSCSNFSLIWISLLILPHCLWFVNNFFQNFLSFYFAVERRWRDLNPRAGRPTYTLSRGASSATWVHLLAWKLATKVFDFHCL